MLALQSAEVRKTPAATPGRTLKYAMLTLLGYFLGVLLVAFYIGPAIGLLALILYLAS